MQWMRAGAATVKLKSAKGQSTQTDKSMGGVKMRQRSNDKNM